MVGSNSSRQYVQRNAIQLASPPHIWISDVTLQRAWHRFTCSSAANSKRTAKSSFSSIVHAPQPGSSPAAAGVKLRLTVIIQDLQPRQSSTFLPLQRRHGSSVPGPLEARHRRSSRKRVASLAFPDSGTSDLDLAALMGMDLRKQWYPENYDSIRRRDTPDLEAQSLRSAELSAQEAQDNGLSTCECGVPMRWPLLMIQRATIELVDLTALTICATDTHHQSSRKYR